MFIFWSVWNPVPTVATTTSCVRQILFSCADTPAWHLWHMDHCRYPRQKRTGRPPYAGLQEIPTSFRVPRDRKVVKRLVHTLIEEEYPVTVWAPTNYPEPPTIWRNSTLTLRLTPSTHSSTSLLRRINSTWSTTPSGSTMPSSLTRPLRWRMTHSIWSMTGWRNRSTDPLPSSLGKNASSPP